MSCVRCARVCSHDAGLAGERGGCACAFAILLPIFHVLGKGRQGRQERQERQERGFEKVNVAGAGDVRKVCQTSDTQAESNMVAHAFLDDWSAAHPLEEPFSRCLANRVVETPDSSGVCFVPTLDDTLKAIIVKPFTGQPVRRFDELRAEIRRRGW